MSNAFVSFETNLLQELTRRESIVTTNTPDHEPWQAQALITAAAFKRLAYDPNIANVRNAFRADPLLKGTIAFDCFANAVERVGPMPWRADLGRWEALDGVQLTVYLQTQGLNVRKDTACDGALVAAHENPIHPVRDFLDGLVWDEVPRLDTMAVNYLGAADTQFAAIAMRKFMIGAVARIIVPGCKMDTMLVLEARQGAGKSRFAKTLARERWFTDTMPRFHGKDAMIQLQSRWIIEVPELEAASQSSIVTTKAFLSKQEDTFRPPYGRQTETFRRQCVFIGTTNEDEYFHDHTGSRRFWPIACGEIDIDRLAQDRDALWAEAVARFRQGEIWHLTDEEEALAVPEQRKREPEEPWAYSINSYTWPNEEVRIRDVLEHIGISVERQDQRNKLRVSRYLKRWGWSTGKTSTGNRCYKRPPTIPTEKAFYAPQTLDSVMAASNSDPVPAVEEARREPLAGLRG